MVMNMNCVERYFINKMVQNQDVVFYLQKNVVRIRIIRILVEIVVLYILVIEIYYYSLVIFIIYNNNIIIIIII